MKKIIITITLLIALVGSVFAKPKIVEKYEDSSIEWEISDSQIHYYTISDVSLQNLMFKLLTSQNVVSTSESETLTGDLRLLLNNYEYVICFDTICGIEYGWIYYLENGKVYIIRTIIGA